MPGDSLGTRGGRSALHRSQCGAGLGTTWGKMAEFSPSHLLRALCMDVENFSDLDPACLSDAMPSRRVDTASYRISQGRTMNFGRACGRHIPPNGIGCPRGRAGVRDRAEG